MIRCLIVDVVLILILTALVKGDVRCNFSDRGKTCDTWGIDLDSNTTDRAAWIVWKGPTPTYGTGPTSDHTNGSDYYIYLEATNRKYGEMANFTTPYLESTQVYVNVTFWYHMHGFILGSLKVYSVSINDQIFPIWSNKQDKGHNWQFVSEMVEIDIPFKIVFRGIIGSQFSDIAVDDIYIQGADYVVQGLTTLVTTSIVTTTSNSGQKHVVYYVTSVTDNPSFIIAAASGGVFWIGILFLLFCYVRKIEKRNSKQINKEDMNKEDMNKDDETSDIEDTDNDNQIETIPDANNAIPIDRSNPLQLNDVYINYL